MTDETDPTDSSVTVSDDVRWVWLGSLVSTIFAVSLVVLIIGAATRVLSLSAITQPWFLLYSFAVLTAVGWVFGKELIEKWQG